jgi:hypothetical protein
VVLKLRLDKTARQVIEISDELTVGRSQAIVLAKTLFCFSE